MTQLIRLTLSVPPSVNMAYRNLPGVGRVKTKAYKDWATEAALCIKLQARGRIAGAYAIHVEIDRPDKRKRDLSNLLKILEDTIVAQGLVDDDSLCEHIDMKWTDHIPERPGPVRVWLIKKGEDDA